MMYLLYIPCVTLILLYTVECLAADAHQKALGDHGQVSQEPSLTAREHWMRRAKQALKELRSPCPFEAFGSVIVNHTADEGLGTEVCIGANGIREVGNPTLHGD